MRKKMREYVTGQVSEYSLADAVFGTVFLSAMTLLCFFSAVFMAQDIFPGWTLSQKAIEWVCGIVIFTAALYEIGMRMLPAALQTICLIGVTVLYEWIGFRYWMEHRMDLEDGACALATEYVTKFNKHLKTTIVIWRGKTEFLSLSFAFYALVIVLILLLLSLLWRRRGILLSLPVAVFAAQMTIGYVPGWKGMALFFTALLFIHADGGTGTKTLRMHLNRRQRNRRTWYVSWLLAVCLAGVTICILSGSRILTDATQQRMLAAAPKVQAFQKKAEKKISDMWRSYVMSGQERIGNDTPRYTGKEMLRVTATKCPSEDMLLKGFCGTDYENGNWYCDEKKFLKACADAGYDADEVSAELLQTQYDLYDQGAPRIMMVYNWFTDQFSVMSTGENTRVNYEVEHTGADSRYLFGPYAADHSQNKERRIGDVVVQKPRRQNTFSFYGWDHFTGGIDIDVIPEEKKSPAFQWYAEFVKEAYTNPSGLVPSPDDYLQEEVYASPQEWEGWNVFDIRSQMRLMRLQQEAKYVQNSYTQNSVRLQMALVIASTLRYQRYSLRPGPLPEGEDPVRYFLMDNHKGYCVHFASAAVLLLRNMGVPARYVSGYVIRRADFKWDGDLYTASVKDSNAHAWVEIYLEQIGWVPIDVTPGAEIQDADEEETVRGEEKKEGQETGTDTDDTQTDTDDTQTDTDDTHKDDRKAFGSNRKWTLGWQRYQVVLFLAVLLTVMVVSIRRIMHFYYEMPMREIEAGKCRAAVRRINRRIFRRLRIRSRMLHENPTDAEYEQMLISVYTDISVEEWVRFMRIVRAAAYAQDEVSQEDARFCRQMDCLVRNHCRKGR